MEVHHHPNVEKKNFKEYFLEFVMIFLAVTLGFFAETLREKITEHTLAKEYAESLVKNLEADTEQLHAYRDYYANANNNVDTLLQLLAKDDAAKIPTGELYWYGLFGGAHGYFTPNDATLQQIKSTGAMRYFKTSNASAMADYDQLCRNMATMQEADRNLYAEVRKCRAQIFEFRYNEAANDIYQGSKRFFDRAKIDSFIRSNPPVLTTDKSIFNEYAELVRSRFLFLNVQRADTLLARASDLIQILQSNYHLNK